MQSIRITLAALALALILPLAAQGQDHPFRRADADANGVVNLTDGLTTLDYLFTGDKNPTCLDAADADVDDSSAVDLSDAINTSKYLFIGDFAVPFPGAEGCGDDITADSLSCDVYASCQTVEPPSGCEPGSDIDDDGLSDCDEVEFYGTSPHLADSDGDGYSDREELWDLGFDPVQNPTKFNPLIADMPKLSFQLTTIPEIYLVAETTNQDSVQYGISSSTASSNSFTQSQTQTQSQSIEISQEATVTVGVEATYSAFPPNAEVSVSAETSYSLGVSVTNETSVSFGRETTQEMQRGSERSRTDSATQGVTLKYGVIQIVASFTNEGNLPFVLADFALSALQRSANDPSIFRPIATLTPDTDLIEIQPDGGSSHNVIFSSYDIPVEVTQRLLDDPNGLILTVSSYRLLRPEDGTSYIQHADTVMSNTAMVMIDFGPGLPIERHRVATNVRRDGELYRPGAPLGITALEALQATLNVPAATADFTYRNVSNPEDTTLRSKLVDVRGTRANDFSHWLVYTDSKSVSANPLHDFEDIVLKARDVLHMVYFVDEDGDGISLRQESIHNTDDIALDSDNDGRSDRDELRHSVTVETNGVAYEVFTNPAIADFDEDGLTDGEEAIAATDPRNVDTDGDGRSDSEEVNQSWIFTDWDGTEYEVLSSANWADIDGDGANDLEEFNALTDPNAIPFPQLDEARYSQIKGLLEQAIVPMRLFTAIASTQYAVANQDYARMAALAEHGLVSQSALNAARARRDSAKVYYDTANNALQTAEAKLAAQPVNDSQAIEFLGEAHTILDEAFDELGASKPEELVRAGALIGAWASE